MGLSLMCTTGPGCVLVDLQQNSSMHFKAIYKHFKGIYEHFEAWSDMMCILHLELDTDRETVAAFISLVQIMRQLGEGKKKITSNTDWLAQR